LKTKNAAIIPFCGLLATMVALAPNHLMAQALPGPITPPPQSQTAAARPATPKPKPPVIETRTTLDGAWNLNRDESDDPSTKVKPPKGNNGGNGGGYPGGRYPGGGYPGGPMGYPFPGAGGPYPGRGNPGPNQGYDQKTQDLVRRSSSLTIALKNAEIDVTDDEYHKLALFTDGRQLQKPKDDSYLEIAAHWDGDKLITDEKSPQGAKMSRTFELSPNGRQLYETLHIEAVKKQPSLYVQYVYDIPPPGPSHETDPDQPVMKRHSDSSDTAANPQGTQTGGATDPDQPVLKRKSNDSDSASSTPTTQNGGTTSAPPSAPTTSAPDPDQPVMKRRTDNSGETSQ
jgi:hypothetical protein